MHGVTVACIGLLLMMGGRSLISAGSIGKGVLLLLLGVILLFLGGLIQKKLRSRQVSARKTPASSPLQEEPETAPAAVAQPAQQVPEAPSAAAAQPAQQEPETTPLVAAQIFRKRTVVRPVSMDRYAAVPIHKRNDVMMEDRWAEILADMMKPDQPERAPVRRWLSKHHGASRKTFVSLGDVKPGDGWQFSSVGFNLLDGTPLREDVEVVSYGILMDGKEHYSRITYEELKELTGKEVNGDNWRTFIPQKMLDAIREEEEPEPMQKTAEECAYDGPMDVDAFGVKKTQAFGSSLAYLRICADGYRAFYVSDAEAGTSHLPLSALPTEEEIDRYVTGYGGKNAYDRLLSADEVGYFMRAFHEKMERDYDTWSDLYNSNRVETVIVKNGKCRTDGRSTNFSSRMMGCISSLAMRGIVRKEAPEEK